MAPDLPKLLRVDSTRALSYRMPWATPSEEEWFLALGCGGLFNTGGEHPRSADQYWNELPPMNSRRIDVGGTRSG
jgi:hypothetical protein